jgi:predicted DNA-binding transcriptional regulator AlpA
MSEQLLLTEPEAARKLAICARTLFTLRASGQIPALKIGRAVRYDVRDIERFIARQKEAAATEPVQA